MSQSERLLAEEELGHQLQRHVREVSAWASNTAGKRPVSVHIEIELADGTMFRKNLVHQPDGSAAISDEYRPGRR